MEPSCLSRLAPPTGRRVQKGWEVSGNSKLSLNSIPIEWPNSGEVLIRIKAAGVCGSDLAQLNETGIAPLNATSIFGLEIAGEIIAIGSGVELWAEGDRVCCLLSGGGFAEFCICPARYCLPIPNGFSWNEAAAIPMGITTGWVSLFEIGKLNAGNVVLVHGASGGVGHIMIQLAKAFNIRVIATCSSADRAEFCRSLGPDAVVCRDSQNFVDFALEFTGGAGVDVVVDMGYGTASMNMEALAPHGKLIQIAPSSVPASLDFRMLIDKQASIVGCSVRGLDAGVKACVAERLAADVWPLLSARRIVPRITTVLTMQQLPDAIAILAARGSMGKVVCAADA
uniref:Enoyl reductase (ER) domain-containing protein n=1 Tax=Cryptomonas curvata TaxID=233186 RepID=A0A7S0QB39_9CRYP|mmetsp:Transcript_12275/g.26326  ORF Transcript_12275/g.26326 Transcript_12275/m.26326 type:complete len:340 (+) Transcript_12275:129-1148(+)